MKHLLLITLVLTLAGNTFAQESRPAGKAKVKAKSKTVQPAEQPKAETRTVKKIGPPRNLPLEPQREQTATQK